MGLHISLPKELENKVHKEVDTGLYQTASEVVREALRSFFKKPTEQEVMSYASRLISEQMKEGKYHARHDEGKVDDIMKQLDE